MKKTAPLDGVPPLTQQPSIEPPSTIRRDISIGLALLSLFLLFALGAWTWFLRDGLGPDSIESSGVEALRRFSADFWPIALFCLGLFGIAFLVALTAASPFNGEKVRQSSESSGVEIDGSHFALFLAECLHLLGSHDHKSSGGVRPPGQRRGTRPR